MNKKIDNTDEARQYLLKFMREHFIDKTFGEYILTRLAGDFAWNLASALAERAASNPASPALQADFETWAKAENYDMDARDGAYESLLTAAAWEAFQAARRAASPAPVAAITDERAAFEAWALTCDGNCDRRDLAKSADGRTYLNAEVQRDLEVWQARAALSSAPMAQAEPRTLMTNEQAEKWAWEQVKRDVGTEGWTIGDHGNYFGFFLHGWRYRAQYERQRPITTPAVPAAPSELDAKDERDAEMMRWFMEDPRRGYRWRIRNHKEQWQAMFDGEPFGKWGGFREVIVAAMSAAPAAPIERENG